MGSKSKSFHRAMCKELNVNGYEYTQMHDLVKLFGIEYISNYHVDINNLKDIFEKIEGIPSLVKCINDNHISEDFISMGIVCINDINDEIFKRRNMVRSQMVDIKTKLYISYFKTKLKKVENTNDQYD